MLVSTDTWRGCYQRGIVGAPRPLPDASFKPCPVLFFAQHGVGFLMLSSYTRAMGRLVDVVWGDLNGAPERRRGAFVMYYR